MSWILKFFFGWTMPFISFLRPSLCGKDGKASGRKISGCVFVFLIVSTTSKVLMKDNPTMIHIYLLCVLVATFLILEGILTVQNIIDIWKNGKPADVLNPTEKTPEP